VAETTETVKPPFPAWLRELCYYGGIIVTLTVFGLRLQSDQRSTREEMTRLSSDVSAIRSALPNKEVYDLRLSKIEDAVKDVRDDLDVETLRAQALRERMMRKGLID
jgi:hypothetical protein